MIDDGQLNRAAPYWNKSNNQEFYIFVFVKLIAILNFWLQHESKTQKCIFPFVKFITHYQMRNFVTYAFSLE